MSALPDDEVKLARATRIVDMLRNIQENIRALTPAEEIRLQEHDRMILEAHYARPSE